MRLILFLEEVFIVYLMLTSAVIQDIIFNRRIFVVDSFLYVVNKHFVLYIIFFEYPFNFFYRLCFD